MVCDQSHIYPGATVLFFLTKTFMTTEYEMSQKNKLWNIYPLETDISFMIQIQLIYIYIYVNDVNANLLTK